MDYEKKYKDALSRAKELCDVADMFTITIHDIITIFPELQESEDERIRKEIIDFLGLPHPQFVGKRDHEKWIAWLEKQGEQKSVDKAEPKFKVGDFIINDYCLGKVIEITSDAYLLDTGQGIPFSCEHNAHLWTIEDAKDGDVLVINDNVFIYAHRKQMYSIAVAQCFVNSAGSFYIDGEFGYEENGKTISPATKEQRDTLERSMTNAGYRWNKEKLKLEKI